MPSGSGCQPWAASQRRKCCKTFATTNNPRGSRRSTWISALARAGRHASLPRNSQQSARAPTSPCTPPRNRINCNFAVRGPNVPLALKVCRRMNYDPSNPLIVQGDRSVLVEVDNPKYAEARDALAPFAELQKSPEHIHTYRITPLSLWNAAATGMTADAMVEALRRYSKFPLPTNLATDIAELVGRYGRVRLERAGESL